MGVQLTVKSGVKRLWLYAGGVFDAGQSATLTSAEYAKLSAATLAAVTVTNGSVTDPVRVPVFDGDPEAELSAEVSRAQAAEALRVRADGSNNFNSSQKTQALLNMGISTSGVADGQQLQYSSTTGLWSPVNPSGGQELAFASNVTGTVTAVPNGNPGASTDIPGVSITVPASALPVVLELQGSFQQTVTGTGLAVLSITETTSGSTTLYSHYVQVPNSASFPDNLITQVGRYRLGPTVATRTFKVSALVWAPGSSAAISYLNAASTPTALRATTG